MDELIDFKKRFLKNGELVSIPKKESYKRIMRSFRLIVCCHSSILIMPC